MPRKKKLQEVGGLRLVAYYRYSGGSGQTEQSIEGQRRDCEAYAKLHGMTIQHEYIDRHISGKTDDRVSFQQMIRDSDKGAFDMVICWKTDRFARNRYDSAVYKKRLRDNGVEIIYAAESNISGAEGIIIEGLMESLAEYYSAELAEKMRRGMRESALKCQAINRCRPLGFTTDAGKKFIIDERTAPAVRFIFEHYAAGESAAYIVEQLNEKGYRTSQGNEFNKSSINRIIQNEMYRGVYISKAYDVRIEGGVPAIVDDELWRRAQAMAKLNKQKRAKYSSKADYFLSGKLYCGECGCLMKGISGHSSTNGEVYRYYACSNPKCKKHNVPKEELEGKVIQAIIDNLLQPEAMEALAEAMVAVQETDADKPNAEREAIQQELADVRRRSKNILDAIENGTANPHLTARLDELTERENTLRFQLSTLTDEKPLRFTKEEYLFLLEQFLIDPAERNEDYGRRVVHTFVTSMEVSDSKLLIYFNISEENADKNKNASPSELQKESSTVKRLVHLAAIAAAREAGAIVSFDPNLRFPLWPDRDMLRGTVLQFLPLSNILKISDEELEFLTGTADIESALPQLFVGDVQLVVYTCGSSGAHAYTRTAHGFAPCRKVRAVDTTGAGDGFIGSFLWQLERDGVTRNKLEKLSRARLCEYLAFSNQFCGISVQQHGAIDSYPTLDQMQ